MTRLRICLIGKYPPIEGGVSVQTYWLCRALAARGHEVNVVTNSNQVESDYRMADPWDSLMSDNGGVNVHDVTPFADASRWYIPQGRPDVTRLAGVAASVIRDHGADVVLSWYLEPYAVAGSLVSSWLGIPHIVRHAGSDLFDLASDPELGTAYRELFRASDLVVSATPQIYGLGLEPGRVGMPRTMLPDVWRTANTPLDLDALIAACHAAGLPTIAPAGGRDPSVPLIGMYGKLGGRKGARELVAAAAALNRRRRVQVALVGVPVALMGELSSLAAAYRREISAVVPC